MSTNHISEDLPRLLTGEASRDDVLTAAEHLRTCPDCQQELVSAVVAHASLMSAHRFAPEIVAPDAGSTHPHVENVDGGDEPSELPDLSSVFAQARVEAESSARRPARLRRIGLAVAAAAVVATGTVAVVQSNSGSPAPSASRSIMLVSTVSGEPGSKVTLSGGDRMRIDASHLPALDPNHQYEVWLTTGRQRDKPQSIGFIAGNSTAEFSVPANVMSQYRGIAVSKQALHQTEYSGVTVLHGTYR